jgi:hypothetical protein
LRIDYEDCERSRAHQHDINRSLELNVQTRKPHTVFPLLFSYNHVSFSRKRSVAPRTTRHHTAITRGQAPNRLVTQSLPPVYLLILSSASANSENATLKAKLDETSNLLAESQKESKETVSQLQTGLALSEKNAQIASDEAKATITKLV